jgi:hypothetical protein
MCLGSGIRVRDPEKNLFRIPGTKRHLISDPGFGSASARFVSEPISYFEERRIPSRYRTQMIGTDEKMRNFIA